MSKAAPVLALWATIVLLVALSVFTGGPGHAYITPEPPTLEEDVEYLFAIDTNIDRFVVETSTYVGLSFYRIVQDGAVQQLGRGYACGSTKHRAIVTKGVGISLIGCTTSGQTPLSVRLISTDGTPLSEYDFHVE